MTTFNINIKSTYEHLGNVSTLHYSRNHNKWSGVYILYGENGAVIYVGKSVDIAKRLSSHAKDSDFFNDVKSLGYYRTLGGYEMEILETYLINELKPLANKGKTYFRAHEYSERISEIDSEINELVEEVEYLQSDITQLNNVGESVSFDGFTLVDEIESIQLEISFYEDQLAELRSERHLLTMRKRN